MSTAGIAFHNRKEIELFKHPLTIVHGHAEIPYGHKDGRGGWFLPGMRHTVSRLEAMEAAKTIHKILEGHYAKR